MGLRRIVGLATIACAFAAQTAMAHEDHNGNACSMIPENNQFYGVGFAGGISENQFNAVLDVVEQIYAPIFTAKGAKLVVKRNWTDGTVNAYAEQNGKNWSISMFGGLARHPETTVDGFAEVACHEIGHHLGGLPKYSGMSWASVEGQSDYYATLKCMRKVIADLKEWPSSFEIDPLVDERCKAAFPTVTTDYSICVRSSYGGLALARLLADLGSEKMPQFNTPDTSKVSRTNENHPAGQCRLDTYFAGAVCDADATIDPSDTDVAAGSCMAEATTPFANGMGSRPNCWYADKATTPTPDEGDDDWDWPWPWPEDELAAN
ncbi:MAG TPA: hypothetical protein VM432_08480 [Bdellovibrionales bacterium]|nr:hypothetical protein [Bdellovibrionales bacterium]